MIPITEFNPNSRLKFFMYGPAKVGKTTAAIQMPKPYIIDTEGGTQYYEDAIRKAQGAMYRTNSFKKTIAAVKALATEKHSFLTVVIDPFTTMFHVALAEAEARVGSAHGRHYAEANKMARELYHLLTQIDMHVVVTAHEKTLYGEKMEKVGSIFDGWNKLDYMFDLIFYLSRNSQRRRVAEVTGSRVAEFPEFETFEWSFQELLQRYGKDRLMRRVQINENLSPSESDDARDAEQVVREKRRELIAMSSLHADILTEVQKDFIKDLLKQEGSTTGEWEKILHTINQSMAGIQKNVSAMKTKDAEVPA